MRKVGVEVVRMAALKLIRFLREHIKKNIYFDSLYIVCELKQVIIRAFVSLKIVSNHNILLVVL